MTQESITHPVGDERPTFLRTQTGTRVHLSECPHVRGTDAHPAGAAERLAHPVCDWSQAQLAGQGREHFEDVEDALRHVGVPTEARTSILDAVRFVEHDEVFVVHSLTYGALARDGLTVATFGKTYYEVGGRRVNLPAYVESAHSGHTAPVVYGDLCPVHFVVMSRTGVCDGCA